MAYRRVASRWRWALAAGLVCVGSAAVGAVAYEIRTRLAPLSGIRSDPAFPTEKPLRVASRRVAPELPSAPAITPAGEPQSSRARAAIAPPRLSKADAARAELQLLRQARAAVARADFAAALPPLAEHARRFRDGRLIEEREALRVRALAGLGRMDEAQRAAAAFEARFPRSVLLPTVSAIRSSGK